MNHFYKYNCYVFKSGLVEGQFSKRMLNKLISKNHTMYRLNDIKFNKLISRLECRILSANQSAKKRDRLKCNKNANRKV